MIEGFVTVVRAFEPEDELAIAKWFSTYDSNRAYGVPHSPCNVEKVKNLFLSNTNDTPDRRNFFIEEKGTQRPLGMLQMNRMDWFSRSLGLGVLLINPEDRGRGLGTDVRLHVMDFVFNHWNMRFVYGQYAEYHESVKVINERLGGQFCGRIPDGIHVDGKYSDIHLYSLDKDTFNSNFLGKEEEWKAYILKRYCGETATVRS